MNLTDDQVKECLSYKSALTALGYAIDMINDAKGAGIALTDLREATRHLMSAMEQFQVKMPHL